MVKTSLRAKIMKMAQGESLVVQIGEYGATTLRTYASELGLHYNKVFKTRVNRNDKTMTIIRVS